MLLRSLSVGALGVAYLACADDPTGPLPECTDLVTIAVSAGTTPTFTWTPACRLSYVLVEHEQGGSDVWFIDADAANLIGTPLVYGVAPPGAAVVSGPVPLVAGTGYRIVLRRSDPGGLPPLPTVATTVFTP